MEVDKVAESVPPMKVKPAWVSSNENLQYDYLIPKELTKKYAPSSIVFSEIPSSVKIDPEAFSLSSKATNIIQGFSMDCSVFLASY